MEGHSSLGIVLSLTIAILCRVLKDSWVLMCHIARTLIFWQFWNENAIEFKKVKLAKGLGSVHFLLLTHNKWPQTVA